MKRKRIVGIIVLMLSLAVFCLAACQPQTREVEAVEPEPTTLAQCTRSFQGIGSICPTKIWQPMGRGRRSPTA